MYLILLVLLMLPDNQCNYRYSGTQDTVCYKRLLWAIRKERQNIKGQRELIEDKIIINIRAKYATISRLLVSFSHDYETTTRPWRYFRFWRYSCNLLHRFPTRFGKMPEMRNGFETKAQITPGLYRAVWRARQFVSHSRHSGNWKGLIQWIVVICLHDNVEWQLSSVILLFRHWRYSANRRTFRNIGKRE